LKDEKPVTFYKFGPEKTQSIAIDVSLNKLKKCINVAYMKLTTPKWKDFKGLKMQWKHRIRLNNVIWRAYYMEFRKPDKKKKTPYCYFAVPDDDTTHTKIEGSVLEGMYWKRRMEAVCAQYKRWRTYNRPAKKKSKACCRKRENSCTCIPNRPPQSQTPNMMSYNDIFDVDEFDNEFTNSLFESLNVPFLFPNPKEIGPDSVGNADIMQPCLLSLQPSIDEINLVNGVDMNQGDSHIILPEVVPANLQIPPYRPKEYKEYKEYDNGSMSMEYRNPQPTRQSSAVSQNVLMSTQMSQPLYSRAIYDSVAQLQPTQLQPSPQSFGNEDSSGRASSTISFGTPTPQPQTYNMAPHIIAAVSGSTVIQPSPSPVFPGSQTSSPFSNHESNAFRNKFIIENNLHQQQQQHQLWLNSVQQQHYQNLQNEQNRRTIQMLQSQAPPQSPLGISPTMGMSNGNVQFGSTLLNLSNANTASSSTITNLIQRNNIMSNHPMHLMQNNNSPLSRYLAPNSHIHQQPILPSSQPPQISGLLQQQQQQTKSNETHLEYPHHNGFTQVKIEKPFIKQQVVEPESDLADDIYRSSANPASAEPSSSAFSSQLTPSFQNLRTESQPSAQIFKSASTGDTPINSAPPTTQYPQRYSSRAQKRVSSNISTRSSPNYTQVASTSSSDAILSDSETNDKSDDIPKRKRRATSRAEVDDSLHPEERKRILHLNAEKNRRNALKDGFDMLTTVIPAIEEAGIKPTNAVVLNRAAQYIRSLRTESERRKDDLVNLKERIEKMNAKIAMLQSNLPSTCRSQTSSSSNNANMTNQIEQSFDRHVRNQSRLNYRYWLMAHTMRPLIQSYAKSVHSDSSDKQKVIASVQKWLNENWTVASLRPLASQMLIYLATEGNLLKNSSSLPEHVMKEINKIT
jgi:MAX-like protein X